MFTAIKFKGYKLFSDESLMELDKISNVNVIIGKNNSGKSSLLDIIEMVYDINRFQSSSKLVSTLVVRLPITRNMVTDMFSGYLNLDGWTAGNYWNKVNGKTIDVELGEIGKTIWQNRNKVIEDKDIPLLDTGEFRRGLDILLSERMKYLFRRLSAERNILPEVEIGAEQLSSAGEGVEVWREPYKSNSRVHILPEEERYMVVVECRKDYCLLITAFYFEHDHSLNKKLKKYDEYKNELYKAKSASSK
ncbi:MAG: AAA family ATPase [Lachnospiraceae bacterium]|nr:AAA family ATPase [Lachnospiraceae bacterium]